MKESYRLYLELKVQTALEGLREAYNKVEVFAETNGLRFERYYVDNYTEQEYFSMFALKKAASKDILLEIYDNAIAFCGLNKFRIAHTALIEEEDFEDGS